jgi:hypothetical protein
MRCGLVCSSLLAAVTGGAAFLVTAAPAAAPLNDVPQVPALQRFLATDHSIVRQATSVRRLEARNDHFDTEAWMDVRATADENGFRYTVLDEGGSGFVRSKALRGALEQESKWWSDGAAQRTWFTTDNYQFEDAGTEPDGLARIGVTPKRKDMLLVSGSIFLKPDDGELVRIEGSPARSPSFWTRRIQVVRHYARIAGVHLPVAVESSAQIRMAGSATFRMTYKYESVNGLKVE